MGRVQKYVCSTRPSARCYWLLAELAHTVDLKRALDAVVMDVQESLMDLMFIGPCIIAIVEE